MQILIKLGDGRLAYCRPSEPKLDGESDNAYLTRIGNKTISTCIRDRQPGWVGASIAAFVDDSVVRDADKTFRDAWDWTTPKAEMDYDLRKCRGIASRISRISESDPRISNAKDLSELKALL